ncbi:hypothetical protein C8R45DRAFT_948238 [Mycena sanguinolenta]|nr:hypothetical protein C8R45DRAFT_948238 [Mycena sanguinolenta]
MSVPVAGIIKCLKQKKKRLQKHGLGHIKTWPGTSERNLTPATRLTLPCLKPSLPEICLENLAEGLDLTGRALSELNDAFSPPFIQPISNTITTMLKLVQNAKQNKKECAQLLEHVHQVLYAIIDLHIQSEAAGSLPPHNNISTYIRAQQDRNKFKQLFHNHNMSTLLKDCHAALKQALQTFETTQYFESWARIVSGKKRKGVSKFDGGVLEVHGRTGVSVLLARCLVDVENRLEAVEMQQPKRLGMEVARKNTGPAPIRSPADHEGPPASNISSPVLQVANTPVVLRSSEGHPLTAATQWRADLENAILGVAAPHEIGKVGILSWSSEGSGHCHASVEISFEPVKGLPTVGELVRRVHVVSGVQVIIVGDGGHAVSWLVHRWFVADLIVNGFSGAVVPQTAFLDDVFDILHLMEAGIRGCRGKDRALGRVVSKQVEFRQFYWARSRDVQRVAVREVRCRYRNESNGHPEKIYEFVRRKVMTVMNEKTNLSQPTDSLLGILIKAGAWARSIVWGLESI